jgi:hypothetical protein
MGKLIFSEHAYRPGYEPEKQRGLKGVWLTLVGEVPILSTLYHLSRDIRIKAFGAFVEGHVEIPEKSERAERCEDAKVDPPVFSCRSQWIVFAGISQQL